MPDGGNFGGLVKHDVISGRRIAIEDLPAAGPHIGEVGGNGVALRIDQKASLDERRHQIERLRHAQRDTGQLDWAGEMKLRGVLNMNSIKGHELVPARLERRISRWPPP